jgi:hypothetical protein
MPETDLSYTGYCPFEAKAVADDGTFEGYASTFGNVDLQGDVVMPNAFSASLKKTAGIVPVYMAHQSSKPIGWGLEAREDDKGLWVKGQFTLDNIDGRNARATVLHGIGAGAKPGLSIGYRLLKDGAEWDETTGTRKLKAIELMEYSVALTPANPKARITRAKSLNEWSIREFEEYLRDAGFSKGAACTIASRGFAALDRRDADAAVAEQRRAGEVFMAELRQASLSFELTKGF